MKYLPGISVRPTRLLDGSYEVNEIWFDNVRVPVGNRIGDENAGWTYAKYLLGYEGTNIAGIGASANCAASSKMAGLIERNGRRLIEDPVFSLRIAQVETRTEGAQQNTNLRVIFAEEQNHAPGPEASILKTRHRNHAAHHRAASGIAGRPRPDRRFADQDLAKMSQPLRPI
ncbi:acyl-CoA dehydrogenase family protein [Dokdonella sp.]|uniref:acyl-CoA dehydrogenase family protein n=1 Tax=Dokdonella sp. TaxID=2291710 RepID=UPI003528388C